MSPVELTVIGSINLDLVATVERLPRAGETIHAGDLQRIPGGKGANQAVAAERLGARVRMVGAVGDDVLADEAIVTLLESGVEVTLKRVGTTGLALILVDAGGETQIVVIPGANASVDPVSPGGAVLCQLEVPDHVVIAAASGAEFFALNAAPARAIDLEPDLLIVNHLEYEIASRGKLVAVTYGAEGAALYEDGRAIARARPPHVNAVDGTAAGDAFAACLVVSLLEGRAPPEALARSCGAGAIAASRFGAQSSLPTADEVDAIMAA